MKVAIVGGGVSGLSTALHLAPLVAQGLIDGPIDIYDSGSQDREIGVGVWNTAIDPFKKSDRESHQHVCDALQRHGTQVRDVGYRTPNGKWLAQSSLGGGDLPSLLFLREMDLVSSLREAVQMEQAQGLVNLKVGDDSNVQGIYEQSTEPWSASIHYSNGKPSEREYHLIVATDGMNSKIRKLYGGHLLQRQHISGTAALPGPMDLPTTKDSSASSSMSSVEQGQSEATGTQDREYTVFRGNSMLTTEESGLDVSFQTWGEGRSQRFAVVPMKMSDEDGSGGQTERQVWFITISDDQITSETDPMKRRTKLLEAFSDWHDPIRQIVEATPPDKILMERALAHKYCMIPVTNFNQVIHRVHGGRQPSSAEVTAGDGPAIVFVGDSFMTIDPILAQGFTIGMEGAAALAGSLNTSLRLPASADFPSLAFDPHALRDGLNSRHEMRLDRLICLLRATELVQALGQPRTGTFLGMISRDIIRPLMGIAPDFVKTPVFNAMMKYSLGLPPQQQ